MNSDHLDNHPTILLPIPTFPAIRELCIPHAVFTSDLNGPPCYKHRPLRWARIIDAAKFKCIPMNFDLQLIDRMLDWGTLDKHNNALESVQLYVIWT